MRELRQQFPHPWERNCKEIHWRQEVDCYQYKLLLIDYKLLILEIYRSISVLFIGIVAHIRSLTVYLYHYSWSTFRDTM